MTDTEPEPRHITTGHDAYEVARRAALRTAARTVEDQAEIDRVANRRDTKITYMASCEYRPCGYFGPWRASERSAQKDALAHQARIAHQCSINQA